MAGKVPTTKLFVGNIPLSSSDKDLRALFAKYGKVVECDIIKDYAFVHFANEDEATAAVDGLDQVKFNGNKIKVEMSKSRVRPKPGMGDRERCFNCGQLGHWSRDCPTENGQAPHSNGGGPIRRHSDHYRDEPERDRDRDRGRERYPMPSNYPPMDYIAGPGAGYPPDYPSRALPSPMSRYHPYSMPPSYPAVAATASAASSYHIPLDELGRPTPEYYERRAALRAAAASGHDYGAARSLSDYGSVANRPSPYHYGLEASRV